MSSWKQYVILWSVKVVAVLAESLNRFTQPLPQSEIRSIARSVSKWIWQRFNPAEFRAVQARRGSRKGASRRAEVMPKVLDMAARGFTQQVIADSLGISQKTISNWLRVRRSFLVNAISDNTGV